MGNICRSPTAHGVFEHVVKQAGLADKLIIDSAGTHAYHVGEQPDRRSQQTALSHGVDLSYIRARQVKKSDFEQFDYVLAMDHDNHQNLIHLCPEGLKNKVQFFLDYGSKDLRSREVPDPYYGGGHGFENVYQLVLEASEGLLKEVQNRLVL